jgi:hypothetical protein
VERVSVGVAQLELDVFVIGFNGPGTDPKFFRDTGGPEPGTNQSKDMQFAVGQVTGVAIRRRTPTNL